MAQTLANKIDDLNDKLDRYIESDYSWKKQAQPSIDLGNNVRGFGVVFAYLVGILSVVGGIIGTIISIVKK